MSFVYQPDLRSTSTSFSRPVNVSASASVRDVSFCATIKLYVFKPSIAYVFESQEMGGDGGLGNVPGVGSGRVGSGLGSGRVATGRLANYKPKECAKFVRKTCHGRDFIYSGTIVCMLNTSKSMQKIYCRMPKIYHILRGY